MGNEGIRQEFKGKILPRNHPATMRVERVLRRLLPNSGLSEDGWEVNVINEDIPNAFVIPGGKVFVFSGLFKLCRTDVSEPTTCAKLVQSLSMLIASFP